MYLFVCFQGFLLPCVCWAGGDPVCLVQAVPPACPQLWLRAGRPACWLTQFILLPDTFTGAPPVPGPVLDAKHLPSCPRFVPWGPQPGPWSGLTWPGCLPPKPAFGCSQSREALCPLAYVPVWYLTFEMGCWAVLEAPVLSQLLQQISESTEASPTSFPHLLSMFISSPDWD